MISDCPIAIYEVRGASLYESAPPGSEISAVPVQCSEIRRNALVIFYTSADKNASVIKRVVGLPGDRFEIQDNGAIFADGKEVKTPKGESYNLSGNRLRLLQLYQRDYHGVIPRECYLLLGDSPAGGLDSSQIGLVPKSELRGIVTKITPQLAPRPEN
jgi:signal peptidase I